MKKIFSDRLYYQSDLLNGILMVNHCFTTKHSGTSCGKISGLNLGFRCGDERKNVEENYRLVAEDMGFQYENITAGKQTHSSNIRIVTEDDLGKGVSQVSDFDEVDALVTNLRNVPLVVFYADCVPILLAEEDAGVIAAIHSGWRGTVSEIAGRAVDIMKSEFGAYPEKIKAAIGPSIGPCCFETGEEVSSQFDKRFVKPVSGEKALVDLWSANKEILLRKSLEEKNIEVLKLCTMCNSDVFYSYRAHKDKTGRMGAFIELKKI